MQLGADANALEAQKYDIVTIASVADDVPMLKVALDGGGKATNITSPYDGTALIAAAHLGHDEVVRMLIAAKAPLDHVNNLGWTALIESIVLGNGGKRHVATLEALVKAGANVNHRRPRRRTPLTLAKRRGYAEMVAILEKPARVNARDPESSTRRTGDRIPVSDTLARTECSRPSRQRQPDAAADQRQPGDAAEPFRVGAAQKEVAARAGGDRPAGIGHRRRAAPTPRTSPTAGSPPATPDRRTAAGTP